jgi:hypothetical protein
MHVTVYGPFFFMETTITGIVYLDMLQQFLIPQSDEDDQEDAFTSSKMVQHLITLKKCAVPQHLFPRSVDWLSSADSMASSFP